MNFEIKNVFLTIEGKSIVNDVSIKVCPGEIVGLMGPNGAGKTSTFNLAVGNLKPDKGDILMNSKSIKNLPLPSRAKLGLGYLTQEASIFRDLTVKENIDLALHNSFFSRAIVRNKREKIINEFNLNKVVDNYGYQLSGGERNRVHLAKMLKEGGKVLLLDEPYEGLAPVIVDEIEKTLNVIKEQGITTVIVEQNAVRALELADRSVILDTGGVVFDGTAKEVLDNSELRAEYLAI